MRCGAVTRATAGGGVSSGWEGGVPSSDAALPAGRARRVPAAAAPGRAAPAAGSLSLRSRTCLGARRARSAARSVPPREWEVGPTARNACGGWTFPAAGWPPPRPISPRPALQTRIPSPGGGAPPGTGAASPWVGARAWLALHSALLQPRIPCGQTSLYSAFLGFFVLGLGGFFLPFALFRFADKSHFLFYTLKVCGDPAWSKSVGIHSSKSICSLRVSVLYIGNSCNISKFFMVISDYDVLKAQIRVSIFQR